MNLAKAMDLMWETTTVQVINTCAEFASAIADVQHKVTQENFSESNFLSVIVDGSMGSSITMRWYTFKLVKQAQYRQTASIALRYSITQLHR